MSVVGRALGLIETKGLIGAIEAADSGVKAARVEFGGYEYADAGMVTAAFKGDVAAVRTAVEAGGAAAAPAPGNMAPLALSRKNSAPRAGIVSRSVPGPSREAPFSC